jgi:hypothetical protein
VAHFEFALQAAETREFGASRFTRQRPPTLGKSCLTNPALIRVLRETHEAPASIQQRIARAGGTNRYDEPNFRVVWGGSRLTWIGGRWVDRDAQGNKIREAIELRRVPKYFQADRRVRRNSRYDVT